MDWKLIMEQLQKPFNYSDIKWRIQENPKGDSTEGEAFVLAYVSNRAIQNRFDEVFGPSNWKNEFKEWHEIKMTLDLNGLLAISDKSNYKSEKQVALAFLQDYTTPSQLCGISVYDEDKKEWITKWDGADGTNFEETKGGLSDAMKRAAYQWGVGRYLYDLKASKAKVKKYGRTWVITENPELPRWAYEQGVMKPYHLNTLRDKIATRQITEMKVASKYLKQSIDDMSINEFEEAMKLLDKVPEKESEKT
jgi:hypothetical protein